MLCPCTALPLSKLGQNPRVQNFEPCQIRHWVYIWHSGKSETGQNNEFINGKPLCQISFFFVNENSNLIYISQKSFFQCLWNLPDYEILGFFLH